MSIVMVYDVTTKDDFLFFQAIVFWFRPEKMMMQLGAQSNACST